MPPLPRKHTAFPLVIDLCGVIPTLYGFPVAAVTNCHTLGGLKQPKLTVLKLRSLTWVPLGEDPSVDRVCAFWKLYGESVCLPSPVSEDCSCSLACGPLPSSKPATASQALPHSITLTFLPLPLLRTLVVTLGPPA